MKKKVLVVDDNAGIRGLLRLALQSDDIELHEAEHGAGALKTIQGLRPDVVILDVMMPGALDGYRACKRIKDDPELRDTYVILLSARGQQADIEEGKRAGADRYVLKPFSPVELAEMVAAVPPSSRVRRR
ncbi:MAG: response regulator [Burkholderiales bacterium]|nr:response regulator [Burkholderiales bacterium]